MADPPVVQQPTGPRVRELLELEGRPRASLTLPFDPRFPHRDQCAKRLDALLQERERALEADSSPEGDAARACVRRLRDAGAAVASAPGTARTLSFHATPERAVVFALAHEAPEAFSIGDEFDVLRLLWDAHLNRPFRALSLSSKRVALHAGDVAALEEVRVEGLPRSLEEALGGELDEPELQYHSSGAGKPIYHGQGGSDRGRQVDLGRFHRVVARALRNGGGTPLVLVADESHQGPFRQVAGLPELLPEGVNGSPDALSAKELHAKVWPVVERSIREADAEAARAFQRERHAGKALDDPAEIVVAILSGRVRRLWMDVDRPVPGHVEQEELRLLPAGEGPASRGSDARRDLAALVLRRGGEVRPVERGQLPADGPLAAELF